MTRFGLALGTLALDDLRGRDAQLLDVELSDVHGALSGRTGEVFA
jgi:hypothetical protein